MTTPSKDAPQQITAPFLTTTMQIEPQWIDYNGHLNMAYYNDVGRVRCRTRLYEGADLFDVFSGGAHPVFA